MLLDINHVTIYKEPNMNNNTSSLISLFICSRASYVSVLTIVAFSLERYLAICHLLHLYAMAGLRRALRIVAALWLVSLLAASPFALYTTVSYHDYPPGKVNIKHNTCIFIRIRLRWEQR